MVGLCRYRVSLYTEDMNKTHYPRSINSYNSALASDNMSAILAIRAACGTRTTNRAVVNLSTTPADVDCAKCRATLPEPTIQEQMQAAHAAGNLDEVIRLAKSL